MLPMVPRTGPCDRVGESTVGVEDRMVDLRFAGLPREDQTQGGSDMKCSQCDDTACWSMKIKDSADSPRLYCDTCCLIRIKDRMDELGLLTLIDEEGNRSIFDDVDQ